MPSTLHLRGSVLLALATLLLAVAGAPVATAASPDAPRVVVLYLERVFEEAELVARRSGELREAGNAVKGEVDRLGEKIDKLKAELASYHSTNPKHAEVKDEIELLALRRKLFVERHRERLDVMELELLRQSYLEIKRILGDYCKEQGIAVVFLAPSGNLQANRTQDLQLRLATQSILFHQEGLDITDAFIAYANALPADRLQPAGAGAQRPRIELDENSQD